MIQNDEELAGERKCLQLIEAALESLRERVLPKNPRNYEIYAEPYIDQINLLKSEIEEYVAKKKAKVLDGNGAPVAHDPSIVS